MMMKTYKDTIPARSSPGKRTAPAAGNQGRGDKYATSKQTTKKIRGRANITIGTWNVRTLNATGKVKELIYEMTRYNWHVIGLCEVRWKDFGETTTEEGHKIYNSGKEKKHEHGVGFLIHKTIMGSVFGCRPISSRFISLRLRASPFNITIVQMYAPTTSYDDNKVETFYDQLQEILDETPPQKGHPDCTRRLERKNWKGSIKDWDGTCGEHCNTETNDRGLRLLEFASANGLLLANTFGPHKTSRRMIWHDPNGAGHQIDYIMMKKRSRAWINFARTRSFPGAHVGSDHDLVMMTFRVHLRKVNKQKETRLKFNLEKLKDPNIHKTFQAMTGGKFAPLTILKDTEEGEDLDTLTRNFSTAITDTAMEILRKHRPKKKKWIADDINEMCDKRRELKNKKHDAQGRSQYRDINNKIRKAIKQAKENWIEDQCEEIDINLTKNTKRAYQIVKDLTTTKKGRASTIQDKSGKTLTEDQEILTRWTEYCSDLYNHETQGACSVLTGPHSTNQDNLPILREEVEAAVTSLKKRKSAGVDNIPVKLVQAGGEAMIDALRIICSQIWQTGKWPTQWTQSLIITLPKKVNLQMCQNYRTISLISHPSKVMLKILLNRLQPQAEEIIAEEQAGFRLGRSTTEQNFNLRVLMEKYQQHQQDLYHVFIDFIKAFDRVWHAALWTTMHKYNIGANLITIVKSLYEKATSAVL